VDITPEEFQTKMKTFTGNLDSLFAESKTLEVEIKKQLAGLRYE
jgi:type I restriction enzyme M protein